ncbi:CHAP domain containing protein [candidate division TM7 genomosp. GTL1]|nr:CHAP domain containing protein [candidate division TM7 genomosp. GTL1]
MLMASICAIAVTFRGRTTIHRARITPPTRTPSGVSHQAVALSPSTTAVQKRRTHHKRNLTAIVSYVAVFALIISFISVGYRSPVEQQLAAQASTRTAIEISKPSVDQVEAADMAASLAETAHLPIASNVANLSISLSAKGELAQTDDNLISKPQIVQPNASSRDIRHYRVVPGDTIKTVAQKFNVSTDTIKWANNLVSDALEKNRVLVIPAVDGVLYTVRAGDTTEKLARKYRANAERIVLYNDLELGGLRPGRRILIPGGILPVNERPGANSGGTSSGGGFSQGGLGAFASASVGNRYDYGYCTWYVYERRSALGRPVGSFWGNATTWAGFASSAGYLVDNNPGVGAVLQSSGGWGGYGHVAIVESVDGAGNVTVSEMNYAGWNVVDNRTISAAQARSYNYIH